MTAVAVSASCGPAERLTTEALLRDVSLPDLSRTRARVRAQVRERYAALTDTLKQRGISNTGRAEAYGRLAMVLDAADYQDAAEPAYTNAQILAPDEPRWPYHLAHLNRSKGDIARSMAAFTRVLELKPDQTAALIWLGRLRLEQGQADRAEALFERARTVGPRTVAGLVGLGQTALARGDLTRATMLLEEALALDPAAASIHSPLAMAYRGLGAIERAEAHLKQWRNTDILVPDPWRQELDLTLESGLSYELRGVRALEARDFPAAAAFFRQGAAFEPATPLGRSLRHKLGTALYLSGDRRGALDQFEEVVRLSPGIPPDETAGRAHYSVGLVMASAGRDDDAIRHFTASVKYSPNYVEALQALGDALRRSGHASASLAPYAQILSVSPRAVDARFGYAMALVRLGRYRKALEWFTEGARLHPERIEFVHAMARVLAAAPDERVRNGARAMTLVQQLLAGDKTIQLGETTAMALAEVGNYTEAAAVLRQVMAAATQAGLSFHQDRMTATLRLYEREQPSRRPWADDDPVHSPGAIIPSRKATREYLGKEFHHED